MKDVTVAATGGEDIATKMPVVEMRRTQFRAARQDESGAMAVIVTIRNNAPTIREASSGPVARAVVPLRCESRFLIQAANIIDSNRGIIMEASATELGPSPIIVGTGNLRKLVEPKIATIPEAMASHKVNRDLR